MISIIGAILGSLGSLLPDLIKIFKDKIDKKHELEIMDRQLEQAGKTQHQQLQMIDTWADIAETKILHENFSSRVPWVDALNGSVRPILAYAFFLLYAGVKIVQAYHTPWLLWNEDDQAIFAGIVSFYFGQRAMQKARAGHGSR